MNEKKMKRTMSSIYQSVGEKLILKTKHAYPKAIANITQPSWSAGDWVWLVDIGLHQRARAWFVRDVGIIEWTARLTHYCSEP